VPLSETFPSRRLTARVRADEVSVGLPGNSRDPRSRYFLVLV